VVVPAESVA
jgi:hypothetical protein